MLVTSVETGISQEISQFVFGDESYKIPRVYMLVCGNDVQSGIPLFYKKAVQNILLIFY